MMRWVEADVAAHCRLVLRTRQDAASWTTMTVLKMVQLRQCRALALHRPPTRQA